jgi:hypothetical protein
MALASSVTGAGILVSSEATASDYYLFTAAGSTIHWRTTISRSVSEWVALTKSAAETWLAGGTGVEYAAGESRSISETNRVLHSYKATSTIETKTTEVIPPA